MSLAEQTAFAARIRNPEVEPVLPGIDPARMAVYQELFFNNLDSFITSGFPVLCRILGERCRHQLLRAFLNEYRCTTPYFLEIGGEFVRWLEEREAVADEPPFLAELAHYERVELALDIATAEPAMHGWSALAWPLAYVWPVQQLCAEFQPQVAPDQPTCLLAWRDAQDRVRFQQLSVFAYHLAVRLQQGCPLEQSLEELAALGGLVADQTYFANARALLDNWRQQGIWTD